MAAEAAVALVAEADSAEAEASKAVEVVVPVVAAETSREEDSRVAEAVAVILEAAGATGHPLMIAPHWNAWAAALHLLKAVVPAM